MLKLYNYNELNNDKIKKICNRGSVLNKETFDIVKEIENNVKKNGDKALKELKDVCKSISFDCLAIKQLDPKTNLNISDKEYDLNFQGDDYSDEASTMYIDAINMEIARCSTESIRYPFISEESIDFLFKKTLII